MGFSGLCRASGARSRAARNAATNPPRGNASEPPARAREQTKCAPTKPLAETTGALRASERRHNLRTGTKQARGNTPVSCGVPASVEPRRGDTTPRTPGVSPGNSLASKTNPSLGEAAQSAEGRRVFRAKRKRSRERVARGNADIMNQKVFALRRRIICGGDAKRRARERRGPRAARTPTVPEPRTSRTRCSSAPC